MNPDLPTSAANDWTSIFQATPWLGPALALAGTFVAFAMAMRLVRALVARFTPDVAVPTRSALDRAVMLVATGIIVSFHIIFTLIEIPLGAGAIESAVLGTIPGLGLILPSRDLGIAGVAIALPAISIALAIIAAALAWIFLGGPWIDEHERTTSAETFLHLAGRAPETGRLRPAFARIGRTLVVALGLGVATGLGLLIINGTPPSPADIVVAQLALVALTRNLFDPRVAAAKAPSPETPPPVDAPPPLQDRVARLLRENGLLTSNLSLPPLPPPPAAVMPPTDLHPIVASLVGDALTTTLIARARAASSTVVLRARPLGTDLALVITALDLAASRATPVLVLTANPASANAFAATANHHVDKAAVPGLIRVVTPDDDSGQSGLGEPSVAVLPAARLFRPSLDDTMGPSLTNEFLASVGLVIITDLDRMPPATLTTLRVALARLRGLRGPAGPLPLLVAMAPTGANAAAFASATLQQDNLEVVAAPLPAGLRLLARPAASPDRLTSIDDPGSDATIATFAQSLANAGIPHRIIDRVHDDRDTFSVASFRPLASPTTTAENNSDNPSAIIVRARRRDLAQLAACVELQHPDDVLITFVASAPGESTTFTSTHPDEAPLMLATAHEGTVLAATLLRHLLNTTEIERAMVERVWGRDMLEHVSGFLDRALESVEVKTLDRDRAAFVKSTQLRLAKRQLDGHELLSAFLKRRAPIVSQATGAAIGGDEAPMLTIDAAAGHLVAPPASVIVAMGRSWLMTGTDPAWQAVAGHDGANAETARIIANLTVSAAGPATAERHLAVGSGSRARDLKVGYQNVRVTGNVTAIERFRWIRRQDGLFEQVGTRERVAAAVDFETVAAFITRIEPAPTTTDVDPGWNDAAANAVMLGIIANTTLREDDIRVIVAGSSAWVIDLARGGHGAARELARQVLGTRVTF